MKSKNNEEYKTYLEFEKEFYPDSYNDSETKNLDPYILGTNLAEKSINELKQVLTSRK